MNRFIKRAVVFLRKRSFQGNSCKSDSVGLKWSVYRKQSSESPIQSFRQVILLKTRQLQQREEEVGDWCIAQKYQYTDLLSHRQSKLRFGNNSQ